LNILSGEVSSGEALVFFIRDVVFNKKLEEQLNEEVKILLKRAKNGSL